MIHLYAKVGLHRYNMLHGTNLQLHHIEKYNRFYRKMPSSYFITLVAKDPSTGSLVTFQTSIQESSCEFDVKCFVARPKSKETKCTLWLDNHRGAAPNFLGCTAPKWPSDDALGDKNRFYVVEESELKENEWIRLYMELAFVTTNRLTSDKHDKLSDLRIVEVVVETRKIVNPPNEKLKGAKNALVYIEYEQDLGEGRFCKYRARIRRSVDVRTGRLSLVGQNEQTCSI
ncbi:unnamed protein product [Microthlaspi erraticum]|uniref:Uncharacterized protein n=1 Tax=Microthlaspi erraticum TaxID=1685480 RepID=A0A6D2ID78_9BRAS|nr:unnamed protein product [Microthlaspi erraticum]